MKKIKEYFFNSKLAFIMMVVSLLITISFIIGIKEFAIEHLIGFIFGLFPTGIFLTIVTYATKNKGNIILKKDLNNTTKKLIIPCIIYIMFWIYFFSLVCISIPEVKITSYEKYSFIDYFPDEIPDNYFDASYYHLSSIPGETVILYLKLNSYNINYYKNMFKNQNVERNEYMPDEEYIRYENTPYSSISPKNFILYTLESQCDEVNLPDRDSKFCNHGVDKHIRINETTNEIIFYYKSW